MQCKYCQSPVVGQKDIVIEVGEGPVHSACFHRAMAKTGLVLGVPVTSLSSEAIDHCLALLTTEKQKRSPSIRLVHSDS